MKKRILVLLSVVALMVVMLAMSVAPASAARVKAWDCFNPTTGERDIAFSKAEKKANEAQGFECSKIKPLKPPKPI